MTYAALILAAACIVEGFLLVCALVGGSEQRDRLQVKVEHRDARIEDLENEVRHRSMGNHPAGRGRPWPRPSPVPARIPPIDTNVVALREALTERDAGHGDPA